MSSWKCVLNQCEWDGGSGVPIEVSFWHVHMKAKQRSDESFKGPYFTQQDANNNQPASQPANNKPTSKRKK